MKYTAAVAVLALAGLASTSPVVTSYHEEDVCGRHEELVGHNCECKQGYIRFKGEFTRCPENARFSCKYKTCRCEKGFVYDSENNACLEVIEPSTPTPSVSTPTPTPSIKTPTPTPSPETPYYSPETPYVSPETPYVSPETPETPYVSPETPYVSPETPYYSETSSKTTVYHSEPSSQSTYYEPDYCGKNTRKTPGGGCDCKLGFTRYDGVNCEKCPVNGHWDIHSNYGKGACVCNFAFKMEHGKCVPDCGKNERFTAGGGCDCIQGYTRYDGVNCHRCPDNGHWDVKTQDCACNFGFKRDGYLCVPNCGPNERFTPNGGCDCKQGFVRYRGGNCMPECPKRSWWNAQKEECQCEWGFEFDSSNWNCVPVQHKW